MRKRGQAHPAGTELRLHCLTPRLLPSPRASSWLKGQFELFTTRGLLEESDDTQMSLLSAPEDSLGAWVHVNLLKVTGKKSNFSVAQGSCFLPIKPAEGMHPIV